MKKLILFAAAALCSVSLSAQIFVGGSLGVNANGAQKSEASVNGTVNTTTTQVADFAISFAPNVGYVLNDKLCVGVRLPLSVGPNSKAEDGKSGVSSFGVGINPYGRYTVATLGKFGLAAEAGVDFGYSRTTNKYDIGGKSMSAYTSVTDFSIYASPVLTYALPDHINLETALNFLRLNYGLSSSKDTNSENSDYTKNSSSGFNFGLNSNNVLTLGAIQIGFTYKF